MDTHTDILGSPGECHDFLNFTFIAFTLSPRVWGLSGTSPMEHDRTVAGSVKLEIASLGSLILVTIDVFMSHHSLAFKAGQRLLASRPLHLLFYRL